MPIGDVCVRDVVVATKDATIQQAAVLMRRHHVGDLVVVEEKTDGRQIPVGIVTDRDIVVSVVAPTLNAAVYTVGDLARELVTCGRSGYFRGDSTHANDWSPPNACGRPRRRTGRDHFG